MRTLRKESPLTAFNLGHASDPNQGGDLTRRPGTERRHREDFRVAGAPWQRPQGAQSRRLDGNEMRKARSGLQTWAMPYLITWCRRPSRKEMESS